MEPITHCNEISAALIARLMLGILFFLQGYDAVFNVKIKNIVGAYQNSYSTIGIPKFFTIIGAWFTSCVELIGGLLLIFGLFKYYTLSLLGLDLVIASFAFGIATPMWDMRHVFPRLVLLIFLLVIPESWNAISLDNLLTYINK